MNHQQLIEALAKKKDSENAEAEKKIANRLEFGTARSANFEVIVHVLANKFSLNLAAEVETIAKDFALIEKTEQDQGRTYRWSFESWEAAIMAGEALKHLITDPNLRVLRVKANYDATLRPISYKNLK